MQGNASNGNGSEVTSSVPEHFDCCLSTPLIILTVLADLQVSDNGTLHSLQASATRQLPTNKDNTPYLTTNQGTRVYNNDHSLTVGPRGAGLCYRTA